MQKSGQATVQVGMPVAAVQAKIDYLLCLVRKNHAEFSPRILSGAL